MRVLETQAGGPQTRLVGQTVAGLSQTFGSGDERRLAEPQACPLGQADAGTHGTRCAARAVVRMSPALYRL